MKKTVSILLCLLIALSVAVSLPAYAAESSGSSSGAGDVIYFDANGWKSFSKVYCHIWVIGGSDFFGWQAPIEECTKDKGTVYKYDLSRLNSSTEVSGGLKSGGKYGVLFSTNTGLQSYDLTIGPECKGDTASLTGKEIENPVDQNKKGYEAVWSDNSGKYGPHLAFTSSGNIVGSKLAPGESYTQILANWVSKYFISPNVDAVAALAKAYPKFGIKTLSNVTGIYNYVTDYTNASKSDLPKIKKTLTDAFYKAYPEARLTDISKWKVKGIKNKTYTGKAIKQKISVVSGSKKATFKVTYSNNKNAGKAKMVIKGTGNYKGTITKTFVINKAANTAKISASTKLVNYNIIQYTDWSVKPVTVKKAQGKTVYKKVSGSSALKINPNGTIVVKQGSYKGLYTAKVKVTVKGNKNYKAKSKNVIVQIVIY